MSDTSPTSEAAGLGRFEVRLAPKLYREAVIYLHEMKPAYLGFVDANSCPLTGDKSSEAILALSKNTRARTNKTANYLSTCPQYCGGGLNTGEYCLYGRARFEEVTRLDQWLLQAQSVELLYTAAMSNDQHPGYELLQYSTSVIEDALVVLAYALSVPHRETELADWRLSLQRLVNLSGLLHGLMNLGLLENTSQAFIQDFDDFIYKALNEPLALGDLSAPRNQVALMTTAAHLVWARNAFTQADTNSKSVKSTAFSGDCLAGWLSDVSDTVAVVQKELRLLEACRSFKSCPSVSTDVTLTAPRTDLKALSKTVSLSFQSQFSLTRSICR